MPLILFSGYPSSGKTKWSSKLFRALTDRIASLKSNEQGSNLKVKLYNDENLGITHEMYRESVTEKAARGKQMSAVRRDLSKDTIVILDGLNYIKGFRYQLFCEAKNLGTTYCVIQVIAPTDVCFKINSTQQPQNKRWKEDLMKALIMRFEEPNGQNRWDSPLIPVTYDDHDLPIDEIWKAIVLRRSLKPNQSTYMKAVTTTNYLQELDRLTSSIIDQIVEYQNLNQCGGTILIDSKSDIFVTLPTRSVSIAELQRLRRTFVSLNRMRSIDAKRITPLFVEFLNHALNSE